MGKDVDEIFIRSSGQRIHKEKKYTCGERRHKKRNREGEGHRGKKKEKRRDTE